LQFVVQLITKIACGFQNSAPKLLQL